MKKTIVLLAILAIAFDGFSQAGSWYIGGAVGYSSSTSKPASGTGEATTSYWAFAPEFGTFLKDDIQLGLALGIGGGSTKGYSSNQDASTLSPTIYTRKFFKITDNFSAFTGLYLSYISSTLTNTSATPNTKDEDTGFGVRVGIGIAYALSPRFTAVGQYGLLGYKTVTSKIDGTEVGTTSSFDFGVNTTGYSVLGQGNGSGAVFNIGIYYTLKTAD